MSELLLGVAGTEKPLPELAVGLRTILSNGPPQWCACRACIVVTSPSARSRMAFGPSMDNVLFMLDLYRSNVISLCGRDRD